MADDDMFRIFENMEKFMRSMEDQFLVGFPSFTVIEPGFGTPGSETQGKPASPRDEILNHPNDQEASPFSSRMPFFNTPTFGHHRRILPPKEKNDDILDDAVDNMGVSHFFNTQPQKPQQRNNFFGTSTSVFRRIGPDGVVEERRTVRDSSGREETTVTRKMDDKEHSVITRRDENGREETTENFINMDEDEERAFGSKFFEDQKPRRGILVPYQPQQQQTWSSWVGDWINRMFGGRN